MATQEQTIDGLLAEIARSQGGAGASALAPDTLTASILERLREEVAKVYQESQGEGGGAGGEEGGGGDGASPRARVQVRHPLPVELWRRAHEVEGKQKPVRPRAAGAGHGAAAPPAHAPPPLISPFPLLLSPRPPPRVAPPEGRP